MQKTGQILMYFLEGAICNWQYLIRL